MVQVVCILVLLICLTVTVPNVIRHVTTIQCRRLLWSVFCVYIIGNLYCTTFSRVVGSGITVELRPFMSIVRLFHEPMESGGKAVGFFAWFMNGATPIAGLILNILLYYPIGYILPILFQKLKPKCVILIGCLCSIATETTQYLLCMGWCETDDVIFNTLGTAIGVWVCFWQLKRLNAPKSAVPESVKQKYNHN